MNDSTVREYVTLIKTALSKVGPDYFKLTTSYEPSGIVRERVFCYELYHQLRESMTAKHSLSLNGEIDKRGHVDFCEKDRKNPDFVFHIQGTHTGDTLVVEVKGNLSDLAGIVKDFETIFTFIKKYQYRAGVFILYNHSLDELLDKAKDKLREYRGKPAAKSIYILIKKSSDAPCEEHLLADVLNKPGE